MSKFPRVIFITLLALSSALGGFFIIRTLDRHFFHPEATSQDSVTPESAASSKNTSTTGAGSRSASSPVEKPVENSQSESDTPSSSDPADSPAANPKTPIQYEAADSAAPASLTAYFSTMRLDNSKLTLRVNIDQYLSSGSCQLLVSDAAGQHIIERTAEIVPAASTSTCAGFDLTPADFGLDSLTALAKPLNLELRLTAGSENGIVRANLE